MAVDQHTKVLHAKAHVENEDGAKFSWFILRPIDVNSKAGVVKLRKTITGNRLLKVDLPVGTPFHIMSIVENNVEDAKIVFQFLRELTTRKYKRFWNGKKTPEGRPVMEVWREPAMVPKDDGTFAPNPNAGQAVQINKTNYVLEPFEQSKQRTDFDLDLEAV